MADDEKVLAQFGTLTLTESKIRHKTKSEIGSALLSEVNAITTQHRHYPILVVLGLIIMAAGVLSGQSDELRRQVGSGGAIGGIFFGGLFVLGYFLTRKTVLTVHAGMAAISTLLGGGAFKKAEEFINTVEASKIRYEGASRVSP